MKIYLLTISVLLLSVFVISFHLNIVTGSEISPYSQTKKQENYTFVTEWGTKGTGNGEFLRPHDLEFSNDYNYLYSVDRDGNRIQVFSKNGTFLFKFGQKGQGNGEFLIPYGLDVDERGNVWVADRGNHRVQEFSSKGDFISKFGNEDSHPSSKFGKFDNPRHVEVDRNLTLVNVADSKNNRIQQFYLNGTFVRAIGELGNKPGEFNLPTTIEQDSKGNFFVTERGNERIQKFDNNWNPILSWGSKGTHNNQFCHLEHLALDKQGNVYVTDPQSDPGCSMKARVLKFDNNGKFLAKIGTSGAGVGQLEDPEHLAVDSDGDVYVSDRKNNKILVYSRIENN